MANTRAPQLDRALARLREIAEAATGPLPSMKTLARELGVSVWCVARAAGMLRDQGILSFGGGKRMRRSGAPEKPLPSSRRPVHEQLAARLRERIEQADLRAGTRLPKVSSLAAEHRVGATTVVSALRGLAEEGLVHRDGRFWTVGPQPCADQMNVATARKGATADGAGPVILRVLPDVSVWLRLAKLRTAPFWSEFEVETRRYGVSVVTCFTHQNNRVPTGAGWVGRDAVRSLVKSLGTRYTGAIVIADTRRLPSLSTWLHYLLEFGRSVVWADLYDEPFPDRPVNRLFTRCHFSEEAGVDLAVRFLADHGHRVATYAMAGGAAQGWSVRRLELLRGAGEAHGLEIRCVSEPEAGRAVPEDQHWTRVVWAGPLMRQALSERGSTAIICPHDYTAYFCYDELIESGVSVPRGVSFISFDNHHRIQLLPVTSVDFGFGYLGYTAFHTLFGMIKVRRTPTGDIPTVPHVVDRGSVGPPPRRRGSADDGRRLVQ